jgi:hypothetical protein
MAVDIHDHSDQPEGLFFATRVGHLQRLEFEQRAVPVATRVLWLSQETHSQERRIQGMQLHFKLEWLRQNAQLQHLSAALIQTGEVCGVCDLLRSQWPFAAQNHM